MRNSKQPPVASPVSHADAASWKRFGWFAYPLIAALILTGVMPSGADTPSPTESSIHLSAESQTDIHRTMGLSQGDCKKCHPSEVAAWMKSTHYLSAGLRLEEYADNTEKYAKALDIQPDELLTTSVCADCHGTKAIVDNQVSIIAGVSCEKCHGASGGDDGWLNRHQSYHASRVVPRSEETPTHRQERLDACDAAGMVRSANIDGLARACYSCHLVDNEKLVAAGHKLASAFEFVSWSEGEVRHNFLLNRNENAEAPSGWLESTNSSVANRRRLKFVVGALVQLEIGLRNRATMTSPAQVPQLGGMIAAANGKLMQVNAVAPTDEVASISALITPMLGRMFAGLPDDEKVYGDAAAKVSNLIDDFQDNHDGSNLAGIDALIQALPPHFSQQFRDKFLSKP